MFKDIIKTLKVNHYIKNLIVFVPLIFSLNFLDINLCIKSAIMMFAFCLISSGVYILNDLIDIEKDKKHPIKRNRAIASGRISKRFAITMLIILLTLAFLISFLLSYLCLLMVVIYFILNVFYSLYLKYIALIDVACIAIGFIIRILAGCYSISVLPSALVILLTYFLSNFFTWAKRSLELRLLDEKADTRESLKELDIDIANKFVLINATLSIAFYVTYMLDMANIQNNLKYMFITVIPFSLIIFRLFLLINSKNTSDDPIIYIEKDKTIKMLFVFYIIVLLLILFCFK